MKPLSIYIHIPFCLRKCLYCDFLSAPAGEEVREQYVQALCGEISAESEHYKEHEVMTVFLGGGTPSLLSGEQTARILACLREHYMLSEKIEITMEMNPGTITQEKLIHYVKSGINRVSIGLQSADNEELERLGRIHTWEDFLCGYELCRNGGLHNINIDLMSALPGQTYHSYQNTLRKVAQLRPEHISAYSLIIEEGTPFYELYGGDTDKQQEVGRRPGHAAWSSHTDASVVPPLPDEETERAMYEETKRLLLQYGYRRYEISNYALEGRECIHNCVYWKRGEYAGFGIGAASMVGNRRWSNVSDLAAYMKLPPGEKKTAVHTLSVQEQMEETMFLGLRMTCGIAEEAFRDTFGYSLDAVYGEVIEKHCGQGLLERKDGRLFLTEHGIDISNYVLADFLFQE